PRKEVWPLTARLLQEMREVRTVVVGVHVRQSDSVVRDPHATAKSITPASMAAALEAAAPILACAKAVEDMWYPPPLTVRWMLITNSIDLKTAIRSHFPGKILEINFVPRHSQAFGNKGKEQEREEAEQGYREMVAEWLLLSSSNSVVLPLANFFRACLFSTPMCLARLSPARLFPACVFSIRHPVRLFPTRRCPARAVNAPPCLAMSLLFISLRSCRFSALDLSLEEARRQMVENERQSAAALRELRWRMEEREGELARVKRELKAVKGELEAVKGELEAAKVELEVVKGELTEKRDSLSRENEEKADVKEEAGKENPSMKEEAYEEKVDVKEEAGEENPRVKEEPYEEKVVISEERNKQRREVEWDGVAAGKRQRMVDHVHGNFHAAQQPRKSEGANKAFWQVPFPHCANLCRESEQQDQH
ncbi:unnamed protein product, partial [Closterium sp. NIES-64]